MTYDVLLTKKLTNLLLASVSDQQLSRKAILRKMRYAKSMLAYGRFWLGDGLYNWK